MSTLEKAIDLLETLPDNKLEAAYAFIQFIDSEAYGKSSDISASRQAAVQSMLGIAHEYANPELIEREEGAFEHAIAEKYAAN